jgi:hypothetical protein
MGFHGGNREVGDVRIVYFARGDNFLRQRAQACSQNDAYGGFEFRFFLTAFADSLILSSSFSIILLRQPVYS